MHRLFVGLRPPVAIRRALIAVMAGVPGARWQDDGQLHITLRFIGEVERPAAEDIATALAGVVAPPLEVAIAGVGAFGSRGRTHTLWAGIAPVAAITALHARIDTALVRAGLAPERRAYRPHVTLARLNVSEVAVAPFLADHAALASARFAIDRFILFESHLGRHAAAYQPVAEFGLG